MKRIASSDANDQAKLVALVNIDHATMQDTTTIREP